MTVSRAAALLQAFGELSYRERRILALRFGIEGGREHSDAEIADIMQVSEGRIQQVVTQALRALDQRSITGPYDKRTEETNGGQVET